MFEVFFLIGLALLWLLFATVQDLRYREVANWLNFSLIVFAISFRFFWSLFEGDFSFFYQGLIGLFIFFIIGNIFYYGRMFAGGDAKLMIALGAILPFELDFSSNLDLFIWFIISFVFVGSIYGFFWSIYLSVKNWGEFRKEFGRLFLEGKKIIYFVMLLGLVICLFGFVESFFLIIGGFVFILPYISLFAKAIDNCCMIVDVPVSSLREGDWLAERLSLGRGKAIGKRWEGLNKKEIEIIKKKFRKVKIKQGIPFVPVFLISFLVLVYFWLSGFNFY